MRGAGEPVFELDFTGGDMMGEIRMGPKQLKEWSLSCFLVLWGILALRKMSLLSKPEKE
jgi:hypothetical protein